MTTTDDRQGRTALDLLRFLPLALIIAMFGVAVLIAQGAPSRMTSGVYEVIVGEGAGQFRLATESLTCSRIGDTATCTAPVAGQQLTIDVKYPDPGSRLDSTCTGRHGDRPVSCMPYFSDSEQAHASVWIFDQLGVTEPELTRLRDAEPWWRTGSEPPIADVALLCALTGAAAGVTTYLLNKRARPQAAPWQSPIAAGTGFLGLTLLVTGILVITPSQSIDILFVVLLFTPAATASAAMGAWQYQLVGAGGHGRARRWVYAIGAAIVTALYTATFVFLLFSGFVD